MWKLSFLFRFLMILFFYLCKNSISVHIDYRYTQMFENHYKLAWIKELLKLNNKQSNKEMDKRFELTHQRQEGWQTHKKMFSMVKSRGK